MAVLLESILFPMDCAVFYRSSWASFLGLAIGQRVRLR